MDVVAIALMLGMAFLIFAMFVVIGVAIWMLSARRAKERRRHEEGAAAAQATGPESAPPPPDQL
ncbi:hypothetical protein BH23ACT6_BH23ACT6_20950 [soil metagenome]